MLFNRERALEYMTRFDLDAIVGTTRHNVFYIGELEGWAQHTYGEIATETFAAFFRAEDRPPAMIVSRQDETYYAATGSPVEDVRGYGPPSAMEVPEGAKAETPEEERLLALLPGGTPREANAAAALVRLLRDRGLTKGRVALDGEGIRPATRAKVAEALPGLELMEGAGLFRLIRLQKTPEEHERIRAAADLNERAVGAFHRALAVGVSEREAAVHYYRTVGEAGAKWNWLHLGGGRRAASIFPPSDRKFRPGDAFFFDAGLRLRGYCADVGGCGVFGEPTAEQQRVYKGIRAGLEKGMGVVRAGVKPSEIFRATVAGAQAGGLPDYNGSFCGHTIGIEARELPYTLSEPAPLSDPFLPETSDIPLPAGAVLSYELPSGRFGEGGVHAEFTLLVTEGGFEHLGSTERTLYRVG